jgi:TetR/AcrR family transcriptional regulator
MEKTRDLARTRERILKAALTEFAAYGLTGARCAAIARRAGVNKRMLFYCFTSKKNLYREILRRKFSERANFFDSVPDDLPLTILHWYEAFSSDFELVRLLEWEALGTTGDRLVGEEERRNYFKRTSARLRRARANGLVPKELDLTQLQISIIALTAFPLAFPQMTRLASGLAPTDPRFRRKRLQFLRWLGERLSTEAPSAAKAKTVASAKKTVNRRGLATNAVRPAIQRRRVQTIGH